MNASPILLLHVFGGTVAVFAGALAMVFRKGSERHRAYGNVFFTAMIVMAAPATLLAVMRNEPGNVFAGVLTLYFIGTAWVAGRRREVATTTFDRVALAAVLAIIAGQIYFGVDTVVRLGGKRNGVPAAMFFFMAIIAGLAAAGDVRMLAQGGITGGRRIARHLWRMLFAMFIAYGSFFGARPQVLPKVLRQAGMPLILTLLPLMLMVFWLARVRGPRWRIARATPAVMSTPAVPAGLALLDR
jgi:uncharacterized membrane protein